MPEERAYPTPEPGGSEATPSPSRLSSVRTQADGTQRRIRGKNLSSSPPSPTPKHRLRDSYSPRQMCHHTPRTNFKYFLPRELNTHRDGLQSPHPQPNHPQSLLGPPWTLMLLLRSSTGSRKQASLTRDNHAGEKGELGVIARKGAMPLAKTGDQGAPPVNAPGAQSTSVYPFTANIKLGVDKGPVGV